MHRSTPNFVHTFTMALSGYSVPYPQANWVGNVFNQMLLFAKVLVITSFANSNFTPLPLSPFSTLPSLLSPLSPLPSLPSPISPLSPPPSPLSQAT